MNAFIKECMNIQKISRNVADNNFKNKTNEVEAPSTKKTSSINIAANENDGIFDEDNEDRSIHTTYTTDKKITKSMFIREERRKNFMKLTKNHKQACSSTIENKVPEIPPISDRVSNNIFFTILGSARVLKNSDFLLSAATNFNIGILDSPSTPDSIDFILNEHAAVAIFPLISPSIQSEERSTSTILNEGDSNFVNSTDCSNTSTITFEKSNWSFTDKTEVTLREMGEYAKQFVSSIRNQIYNYHRIHVIILLNIDVRYGNIDDSFLLKATILPYIISQLKYTNASSCTISVNFGCSERHLAYLLRKILENSYNISVQKKVSLNSFDNSNRNGSKIKRNEFNGSKEHVGQWLAYVDMGNKNIQTSLDFLCKFSGINPYRAFSILTKHSIRSLVYLSLNQLVDQFPFVPINSWQQFYNIVREPIYLESNPYQETLRGKRKASFMTNDPVESTTKQDDYNSYKQYTVINNIQPQNWNSNHTQPAFNVSHITKSDLNGSSQIMDAFCPELTNKMKSNEIILQTNEGKLNQASSRQSQQKFRPTNDNIEIKRKRKNYNDTKNDIKRTDNSKISYDSSKSSTKYKQDTLSRFMRPGPTYYYDLPNMPKSKSPPLIMSSYLTTGSSPSNSSELILIPDCMEAKAAVQEESQSELYSQPNFKYKNQSTLPLSKNYYKENLIVPRKMPLQTNYNPEFPQMNQSPKHHQIKMAFSDERKFSSHKDFHSVHSSPLEYHKPSYRQPINLKNLNQRQNNSEVAPTNTLTRFPQTQKEFLTESCIRSTGMGATRNPFGDFRKAHENFNYQMDDDATMSSLSTNNTNYVRKERVAQEAQCKSFYQQLLYDP